MIIQFGLQRTKKKPSAPKSDLNDGQAGTNCETFWRVKSMFTLRHIMPMPLFLLKETHFSIRLSRDALDPKTVSGLTVKLFGASHPKKQELIKKHPGVAALKTLGMTSARATLPPPRGGRQGLKFGSHPAHMERIVFAAVAAGSEKSDRLVRRC